MGTRTEHAPGTFSWVDLTTSDAEGAKRFYGELLGWEFEDHEIPGGGSYSMCTVGGEYVAAIPTATDKVPPHWNNYVTVESADEAAARAEELGAVLVEAPFDVMASGRMALFRDPTGAALCVWEPREAIGAGRVNDPGCLTWNELRTSGPAEALEFYRVLFGWNVEEIDTGGGPPYLIVKVGERSNGSVTSTRPGEPPHWLPYFTVEDRDGAAETVEALAGRELYRLDLPNGRIAVFSDPQGAVFAVFAGDVDD